MEHENGITAATSGWFFQADNDCNLAVSKEGSSATSLLQVPVTGLKPRSFLIMVSSQVELDCVVQSTRAHYAAVQGLY